MAVSKPKPPQKPFAPDERQQQAIEHVRGPMLVVAGAGTGKTTVLTRRIARLIYEGHARPDEILATTYTKNAAEEMLGRVRKELGGTELDGSQINTFHAYCDDLLRRYGKKFGVLDDKDLWIYLRKRLPELHLNYFVRAANAAKFLDDLLDFMRRCHDELVGPEQYAQYVQRLERGELPVPRVSKSKDADALSKEESLGRCREIASVFATVERTLAEESLGTFSHMITRAHDLLTHDPEALAEERKRSRFILVDEFQDANFAQIKILRMLAGEEQNVFAVGDPDQAIYRFRGASSAAFGLFQRQFPGAQLVALEKNRRSTTPILKCAFALISKNQETFSGSDCPVPEYRRSPLISARDEDAQSNSGFVTGAPVEAALFTDKELECSDLAKTLRERKRQSHCAWKDFAVLYRQHTHRDQLAGELAERQIPFVVENMDVLDTPEVRDLLACLGAVVSEADGASLFRVATLPQFAIDPQALQAGIRKIPRDAEATSVASVLREVKGGPALIAVLHEARAEIQRTTAKGRAALEIIARKFQLDCTLPNVGAALDFVKSWEEKPLTKTGEVGELLEYLEYFREAHGAICLPSRDEDAVRLMTAHAAKGLEFKHVFIIRANSNSFPSSYKEPLVEFPRELRDPGSVALKEGKELHQQEERRLFYVATTRARDSLTIYAHRGKGKKDPTPNGFMRDLIKETNLQPWFRQREAQAFQTDMFGEASAVPVASRSGQWFTLPPAKDLSARLSATAIETYETCPLQFKLEREWRIPSEVPAAMQYGAAMHRVLRTYYDSVRFQRPMAEEEVINLFRADLAGARLEDAYQQKLYEKQGIEQLIEFLRIAQTSPLAVLHTEEQFEMKIGETTIVGRMDRVDQLAGGEVVITDYKTGKPKSQEDADESLQLSIYALAAAEKWKYKVDHLVFYNLEENAPITTRRSTQQLQGARLKVEEVAEDIGAGKYDAKTGYHCRFCAYRNLCPATEKKMYSVVDGKHNKQS